MTTELFSAIAAGDRETVERLLAVDPSLLRSRNADGVSPIVWARYTNEPELADSLADRAESLDLFEAAAVGRVERVAELLDSQAAEVGDQSPDGFSPLHLAAFFGHPEVARLLVERGAPLDCVARNDMSVTPLHSAVSGRHDEVARLLVDAGADVTVRQQGGWTPLHSAAQNGNAELVDQLLARGADPVAESDDGATPADLAAAAGHTAVVARL